VPCGFDLSARQVREPHGLVWYWYGDSELANEIPWFPKRRIRVREPASWSATIPFHTFAS
jgi:hypothetical protein